MLADALERCVDGPAAIRYARGQARQVGEHEVGHGLAARCVHHGSGAVALVGVGKLLAVAVQAAERLAERGIDATVWDPRVVSPFDPAMVKDLAGHRAVVTIEDGIVAGGVGSHLAAALCAEANASVPRLAHLGLPTRFIPHGKADRILASLGLDADGVAAAARKLLED